MIVSIESTDGNIGTVKTKHGSLLTVQMFYPYGFCSNIPSGDSDLALMFDCNGLLIAIPYDIYLQKKLDKAGVAVGNFKDNNYIELTDKITMKSDLVNFQKDANLDGVLKINEIQVVKEQQPPIIDPTGGVIIDSEARTAIISILNSLRNHGLIA